MHVSIQSQPRNISQHHVQEKQDLELRQVSARKESSENVQILVNKIKKTITKIFNKIEKYYRALDNENTVSRTNFGCHSYDERRAYFCEQTNFAFETLRSSKERLGSLFDGCFKTIQQNVSQKQLKDIVTSLNDLFMFHNEINRASIPVLTESITEPTRGGFYTKHVYSPQVVFKELDVAKLVQDGLIKMLQEISPSNCSNNEPMLQEISPSNCSDNEPVYKKAGPLNCWLMLSKLISYDSKRAMREEKCEQINKEEEKCDQINKEEEKRDQIEKLIKDFNELRASDSPVSVTQSLEHLGGLSNNSRYHHRNQDDPDEGNLFV